MNIENAYFTPIYLHRLTTTLTKAPYLDFQHAYTVFLPLQCQHNPKIECGITLQERQERQKGGCGKEQ